MEKIGNPRLMVEPGRAIVGDAGITLARVVDIYPVAGGHPLVTLDLGIVNHGTGLVEPDLYTWTLANDIERKDRRPFRAFVAGRLCFSGDLLSRYPGLFPPKTRPGRHRCHRKNRRLRPHLLRLPGQRVSATGAGVGNRGREGVQAELRVVTCP